MIIINAEVRTIMKRHFAALLILICCAALLCSCAPKEPEPSTGVIVVFAESTEVRSVTLSRGGMSETAMRADGHTLEKGDTLSFDSLAGEWTFDVLLYSDVNSSVEINSASVALTIEENKQTKIFIDAGGKIYTETAG